jgi:2-C-methyl-D-erythritol 4-phosphate cytidylyltransferase
MHSAVCAKHETTALILAAGDGQRLGGCPKAFVQFDNATLLTHAISTVAEWAQTIVVGVRTSDLEKARACIEAMPEAPRVVCVCGGSTRQESLQRLLECVHTRYVLLHEVARPWALPSDFENLLIAVREHPAAVLYTKIPVRDSVAVVHEGHLTSILPRTSVVTLQTPHAYEYKVLAAAYKQAIAQGWSETSTAALVQKAGFEVHLIEGSSGNVKITY